jgi:signal transduction histidine kinase
VRARDVLLDQLPLVVAYTLAVAFLLLVVHLGVAPLSWGQAGYVLLLALVTLAVVLAMDVLRKAVFRREVARRLAEGLAAVTAPLPQPASREQRAFARLLEAAQGAAAAELADLRRQSEDHRTFVDMWVHQMKTPVSVIQLAASRRDEGAWDDVAGESERLAQGLELMLATARLGRFELDNRPAETELVGLARATLNELRGAFIRAEVYPRVEAQGEVRAVTDPKWLRVVLRQLLTNAVRYGPPGSTVTVDVAARPGGATLSVTDAGPGIPEEDLPRVFERFFTGANGRAYGASTGMGLYVAAEVCRRLGHELTIASKRGEGTTATVRLRSAGVHLLNDEPG